MKNTFLAIVALAGIQLGAHSALAMDVGLSCSSTAGDIIEVTPLDAKSLNVNLISKSGSLIDDNNYIIAGNFKTRGGSTALVAQDEVSGVVIQVLGLDSENLGQLKVVYSNALLGFQKTFSICDIVE